MDEVIRFYTAQDRSLLEEFRAKTFDEGNTSLDIKRFDPGNLDGQIFLFFKDNELASISVVENSKKYTEESESCRICRYHILKKFRHCNAGFKMLPHQVKWAFKNGYKLIFWTHDVNNRALNAMYQHKRRMPNKQDYFNDPLYKSFKFLPQYRFITGSYTQYVYAKHLDMTFNWEPKGKMIQVPV